MVKKIPQNPSEFQLDVKNNNIPEQAHFPPVARQGRAPRDDVWWQQVPYGVQA